MPILSNKGASGTAALATASTNTTTTTTAINSGNSTLLVREIEIISNE